MKFLFVIIDDRELDCYIAKKNIMNTGLCADAKIFYDALSALSFIKDDAVTDEAIVVLLDIMMPVMNGFQFMDEFEKLSHQVKAKYKIVAITTSLDKADISGISNYPSVVGVLKKPFTSKALMQVLQPILPAQL